MNNDREYIKIDIVKIAEGLLKRLWVIILAMVVCVSVFFSYGAFMVTPMYEATTLMYVNNSSFSVGATSFSISASEINAAKSLVETYMVILKTRLTLNEVIERGKMDLTYEQLAGMISVGSVNETEVFYVTVTSPDPLEAEHIANTIAQVLPDKIAGIVEGSSVSIVDYAVVPSGKVSPNLSKYAALGLMLGLFGSVGIIVLIEILDDQIRSESYLLENYPDIPLLSAVPDMLATSSRKGYYYYYYGHKDKDKDKDKDKKDKSDKDSENAERK